MTAAGFMKRILVVDDEEDLLKMLRSRLTSHSYAVLTAKDGREGLSVAKSWKPDLIVLDILMPEMDGTQMSAALKEDPNTQDIPILFLTVLQTASQPQANQPSPNVVLAKPFSAAELLEKVEHLIRK